MKNNTETADTFFKNLNSAEQLSYENNFPLLFHLMESDQNTSKTQKYRKIESDFYTSELTIAQNFYKLISQI